jgi:hypothetical protein
MMNSAEDQFWAAQASEEFWITGQPEQLHRSGRVDNLRSYTDQIELII